MAELTAPPGLFGKDLIEYYVRIQQAKFELEAKRIESNERIEIAKGNFMKNYFLIQLFQASH
jgi:hypothetical protein